MRKHPLVIVHVCQKATHSCATDCMGGRNNKKKCNNNRRGGIKHHVLSNFVWIVIASGRACVVASVVI